MPKAATGELRFTELGAVARITLKGKERKAFVPLGDGGARANEVDGRFGAKVSSRWSNRFP